MRNVFSKFQKWVLIQCYNNKDHTISKKFIYDGFYNQREATQKTQNIGNIYNIVGKSLRKLERKKLINRKGKSITLTDMGVSKAKNLLGDLKTPTKKKTKIKKVPKKTIIDNKKKDETKCKICFKKIPANEGLRTQRGDFCNGTCYSRYIFLKYRS